MTLFFIPIYMYMYIDSPLYLDNNIPTKLKVENKVEIVEKESVLEYFMQLPDLFF